MCQRLFLIKSQALVCNFIKKETLAQVFSCEFCKISKNTFFIEHIRVSDCFRLYSLKTSENQSRIFLLFSEGIEREQCHETGK